MARVSGPSSFACSRVLQVFLIAFLLGCAALAGTVFARPHEPPPWYFGLFFTVLYCWGVACLGMGIAVAATVFQRSRELRAGYTWTIGQYRNAAQVDPGTMIVVREPGAPFLTREQLKEATARAREWAGGEGVTS